MSETAAAHPELVTELKASAHLMRLDPGVYCVYHSEGSPRPDPVTGLPGARLTLPPGPGRGGVMISGFQDDGWISVDSASLIRVTTGPAQVLMTVYQVPGSSLEAPRMQVRRLIEGAAPSEGQQAAPRPGPVNDESKSTITGGSQGAPPPEPEIAAHLQLRGDVLARIGDWIGEPGSQRWIEGFAVAPRREVQIADIEYQAVLGRGWLSPWAEGGQYCGSRGMALPILGLRARLRGAAASTHVLEVSATFTDGSKVGPVGGGEPCEADSLAPLEAFQLTLRPVGEAQAGKEATATPPRRTGPRSRITPEPAKAPPRLAPVALAAKPKPAAKPVSAKPAARAPAPKRGPPPAKGRGR